MSVVPGTRLGVYEVRDLIGSGGTLRELFAVDANGDPRRTVVHLPDELRP